jgi:hypothetical protein
MSEKNTKPSKKPFGQKKPFTPKQVRLLKEILSNKGELRDLVYVVLVLIPFFVLVIYSNLLLMMY